MANFPQAPLPLKVYLAPGANPGLPTSLQFTDITNDVRVAEGVSIQAGRQDEGDQVDTTQVSLTLDDRSNNYQKRNPVGAYYGKLFNGTPIMVAVRRMDDTFTRVVAAPGLGTDPDSGVIWSAGTGWSANGTQAQMAIATVNGIAVAIARDVPAAELESFWTMSINTVPTGGAILLALMFWRVDANTYYRAHYEFMPAGTIQVKVSKTVNNVFDDVTVAVDTGVTYTANQLISCRTQVIGSLVRFKVWQAAGAEPAAWTTQFYMPTVFSRGKEVGFWGWRTPTNTNAGTPIISIEGFRLDNIRSVTPVPEWPARWGDPGAANRYTPIVGAGVMRRLAQGQSALRSALFRALLSLGPQQYLPCEEANGASVPGSAVAGLPNGTVSNVTFGDNLAPPGGAASITLNTLAGPSSVTMPISKWTIAQDGYAVIMCWQFPSNLPSVTSQPFIRIGAQGTVTRWEVQVNSASFTVFGYDKDDNAIVNGIISLFIENLTKPWAVQFKAWQSAVGTVTWQLAWQGQGKNVYQFYGGTYSGTVTRPTSATALAPIDGATVSHLWAGDDAVTFFSNSLVYAFEGWLGEGAGPRIRRLSTEEGIPLAYVGSTLETSAMGIQTPNTYMALVRECEEADQGVLFERGAGIAYLTRAQKYNQTPAMVLDFALGHVSAKSMPEPTDDDAHLRNLIRLSLVDGTEAVAQDNTSIARSGVYTDELSVNLAYYSDLPQHAGWRLHLGTVDEVRWPKILLQLHRNVSLIAPWCRVEIGSRITIANPPAPFQGQTIDLIVEGWTEHLSIYSWEVELNCSPASPWTVAVADTARADATTTTLASGVTSTATSWPITTVIPYEAWSTTAVPYAWTVGGETVTVTAMTAAVGTGPVTQTATVTRSVNGIVKAQTSGTAVHLAQPATAAL